MNRAERDPSDVWLPTTNQIVMASERAILAALDAALLLAARTLEAEHATSAWIRTRSLLRLTSRSPSRSSSSPPACASSSPATAPRPTTSSATADLSSPAQASRVPAAMQRAGSLRLVGSKPAIGAEPEPARESVPHPCCVAIPMAQIRGVVATRVA